MESGSEDPSRAMDEASDRLMVDEVLQPEVLTLHRESITSDAAPDEERYKLSHCVAFTLPREKKGTTYDQRIKLQSSRGHLFFLVRPHPHKPTGTWHIMSKWPEEEEDHQIVLQASKEQFTALLRAEVVHTTVPSSHPEDDHDILLTMKPRWLSTTEFNYLDGDGRQLACEERDGHEYKLIVTVEMSRGLRDALVALWCLRVWRETMTMEERKLRKDVYARRWS